MYNEIEFTKFDPQWNFHEDYYVLKDSLPDDPDKYFVNLMLNTCKLYCPDASQQSEAQECAVSIITLKVFRDMESKLVAMRS